MSVAQDVAVIKLRVLVKVPLVNNATVAAQKRVRQVPLC